MSVRLNTLGPPRCFVNDSPTDLPAQKLRFALLLYLSVEKRVARESVAAMFWPERDEERARHALSQTIYELRRLLGEEWLDAQPDPLEVTGAVEVDALEFERRIAAGDVERALTLYTGEFLAGFHLKGSNDFESWVEGKRRELKRMHHRACRGHITTLIEQDRTPQAEALAHRWAEIDRLDDEANHAYIDVLARTGKRAEAIAHFETYEKRIRAELDVAPLDETRALIASIRHATSAPDGLTSLPNAVPLRIPAVTDPTVASPQMPPPVPSMLARPVTLWWRLKQSRIAKTAAVYTASTYVVIQFLDVMVPALRLPDIIVTITAAVALLGFPVAILIAWAFDNRDEQSQETADVRPHASSITLETLEIERERGRKLRNRAVIVTGFATIVSAVLLYSAIKNRDRESVRMIALDNSLYMILPFTYDGAFADSLNEDLLIRDAISGWDGVSVVEPLQVHEAIARVQGPIDSEVAAELARRYGSGRFLRGHVMPVGDSLRIQAVVYDAGSPRPAVIASVQRRVARNPGAVENALSAMVEELLLTPNRKASAIGAVGGSRSVPARKAFVDGLDAVQAWDLARADSQFERAAALDQSYTQAMLWLGLVRSWARADTALWKSLAHRALEDSAGLTARDNTLAQGLLAVSNRDFETACEHYRRLAQQKRHDFVAWYALADCLSRDPVVVRDPASRSGWSFRSSYHSAASAYRRAYELLPSMHKALVPGSFENVRRVLKTSATALRPGYALPPDTQQFASYAGFRGDTLEFIPIPTREFVSGYRPDPAELERAVRHQRAQFHSIATTWTRAFPASAEALHAVAVSLAMLDDETAIDSLQKARSLALTDEMRFSIAMREAEARIKFDFPADVRSLRRARSLADSLLSDEASQNFDPMGLAALAMFTGRGELAVRLMRSRRAQQLENYPLELGDAPLALNAYTAIGGPADSIRALDARVRARLGAVPAPARTLAFMRGYVRPARLAFPNVGLQDFAEVAPANMTTAAQYAFAQGDRRSARSQLNRILLSRQGYRPEDFGMDAVYAEALLLIALGEPRHALDWVMPSLRSIRATAPDLLLDPVVAATLMRTAVLAAELSQSHGHAEYGEQFATAASILMENSDPLFRSLAERASTAARRTR